MLPTVPSIGAKPFVLAPSARAVEAVREAAAAEDAMTVDHQPKAFQVYRQAILPIAVGERVMVTQNNARRGLYNGDLVKDQKIEGHLLHLDNHRVLDASQALHLRQGYSVSSQASQGHQPQKEQTIEPDLQEQLQAARLEKEIQKAVMKHYKVLQRFTRPSSSVFTSANLKGSRFDRRY